MATKAKKSFFSSQQRGLSASLAEQVISALVLVCVLAVLILGWVYRSDGWVDPEHGLGYALGIIGGSLMLLLLAYPLRKRARKRTRAIGSVGFWFRLHMLLGLLGPLAVLFHSRFTFGSLNSAVALGAMIIVASSGLIGRFLYSRVHRGYSDRKLELRALKQDMDGLIDVFSQEGMSEQDIRDRIQPFEDRAIKAGGAFWSSAGAVIGLGIHTRAAERRLSKSLARLGGNRAAELSFTASDFFTASRRAAEFAFYDRLLRLWHLLHLPLFFLLVAAVVLHIVAVHMY